MKRTIKIAATLVAIISTLFLTSLEAAACLPCTERHHTVCGPNPKHPNCHEVFTCEGGTCGHHDDNDNAFATDEPAQCQDEVTLYGVDGDANVSQFADGCQ